MTPPTSTPHAPVEAAPARPAPPRREAHAHIAQHGRAMTMLRLETCTSAAGCLERVAEAARQRPAGWILGAGLRVEGWSEPRWPTADELDEAAGGRPCCLWSFDHHALVASTAALAAAGIDDRTPDPPHGRIVRDERARPTGLLLESAAMLAWKAAPEPTLDERQGQVLAALADFRRLGFVEVHDLHAPLWLGPLLARLDDQGRLDTTVWLYVPLAQVEQAAADASTWSRPRVRLAGAKLFADGTLNSRTAWMTRDYADPLPGLPRGQAMASADDVAAALTRVARLGLGLAVHAIGDAAVRAVLDGFERSGLAPAAPTPDRPPPLRVEHAELIDEADVPRFARLGVVASVQPCHLLADMEVLRRSLPHRLGRVLPLRELIDHGAAPGELLWFGSDAPIVRPEPEDSLLAATARRRAGLPAAEAIAPEQAIPEADARAAFSLPARAPGS